MWDIVHVVQFLQIHLPKIRLTELGSKSAIQLIVTNIVNQTIVTRKILMISKRYESTEVDRRIWLVNQTIVTRKILMISKRYESTEVDRRIWLHVQRINRGWPQNMATCAVGDSLVHQQWHSQRSWNGKEASTQMYTPFSIGFNLQYGTICAFRVLNPRRWSVAKQCNFKSWKVMSQKCQNKLKPKGMV